MRRVDVEENPRYDDSLLLQQLLEERQAVVEGRGQRGEVEPDVEGAGGGGMGGEPEGVEPLEDMVTLSLEVLLKGDSVLMDADGVEHGNGGELKTTGSNS